VAFELEVAALAGAVSFFATTGALGVTAVAGDGRAAVFAAAPGPEIAAFAVTTGFTAAVVFAAVVFAVVVFAAVVFAAGDFVSAAEAPEAADFDTAGVEGGRRMVVAVRVLGFAVAVLETGAAGLLVAPPGAALALLAATAAAVAARRAAVVDSVSCVTAIVA